jgi:exo-beta-1,3-glucanase (GH17 family)
MKPIFYTIFSLIVFVFFSGCSGNKTTEEKTTIVEDSTGIKQEKENLLAGEVEAVCYSGFRSGQHPDRGDGAVNPSYEEILEDLQILTDCGFRLIRVYDSGENSEMVLRVISENNLDMKVLLGIWLRAELSNHETCEWLTEPIPEETLQQNKILNLQEIEKGAELANGFDDIVVAVNVGNEALVDWNDHKVDTDTIISYVKYVKRTIAQPVTVADNYKWWADHGTDLAKVVDFVSVHTYPVWEEKDIDEGLSYTIQNIEDVRKTIPDVPIVITEAGWATTSSEFGERASEEKQLLYYEELMGWANEMNITTFFFEAFDEDWKGDPNNPLGAEKHWGLFTVDRKPKIAAIKLLKED